MSKIVWKSIKNIPRKNKPIFLELYTYRYEYNIYKISKYEKWKDVVSKLKVTRWAYVEDLVPPVEHDFCPHVNYCKNACPCICDEYCKYEPKI